MVVRAATMCGLETEKKLKRKDSRECNVELLFGSGQGG